jgi:Tol biopolymer transport system component
MGDALSSNLSVTDIYVMNADGSGVTRLTTNLAYDGKPSCSPAP